MNHRFATGNVNTRNRKGTVLITVLVCMGVVLAILLATVQLSITVRRQTSKELQVEQARWVLDAGVRRAKSKLKRNPQYLGETIRVESDLVGESKTSVTVALQDRGNGPALEVVARIDRRGDKLHSVQRTREIAIP